MNLRPTLILLTLIVTLKGQAQQVAFDMDSIVVTASRLESSIDQSGKSVSVYTADQIAELPVNSVDELLRFVTGINMNVRNGFGVQSNFGIRGSTFSQVLVMVDDIRLNDPLTGHFNQNFPVSVAEIAQLEIIRGPASASYGPDAVGGVIHIKTKTYVSSAPCQNAIETQGQVGFGEHGLFTTDIGIVANTKKLQFSAGIKSNIADGETLRNPNFDLGQNVDSTFNNHFDLRTYSASLAYFINDHWKVYARAGYDERAFSAKYFYTSSPFDESEEMTDSRWTQLAVKRSKGQSTTTLHLAHKRSTDLFVFNPLFTPNDHTMHSSIGSVNHETILSSKGRLAVGTQVWRREVESTDRGDHEDMAVGLYGVYAHQFTDELKAVTSLRLDYDENYEFEVLPQISLAYTQPIYTLRASAGRTVRAADFTERFVSYQLANLTPGRNVGNPDLQAENAYSFELGGDLRPSKHTRVSATAFYRTSSNLIDYVLTNSNDISNLPPTVLQPDENYFYASNVSEANTWGIELQADHQIPLNYKNLVSLSAGYTYLSTTQDSDIPSRYIANHPDHNVNVHIGYRGQHLLLTAMGNYIHRDRQLAEAIGAEVSDNYFIANVCAEIMPLPDVFSFYVDIQNILDTDYQEILGAQLPGRWLAAGIRWQLNK